MLVVVVHRSLFFFHEAPHSRPHSGLCLVSSGAQNVWVSEGSMDQADVHEVWSKWSEKLSSWWRTGAKPKKGGGGVGGRIHTGQHIHMYKYDSD